MGSWVFSLVGLNKTKTRNSLALDGTLSSIMATKMAGLEPCFRWEPPTEVIKTNTLTPFTRTKYRTIGDRAFVIAAPTLWNSIPLAIRNSDSLPFFKSHLKTHLLQHLFPPSLSLFFFFFLSICMCLYACKASLGTQKSAI